MAILWRFLWRPVLATSVRLRPFPERTPAAESSGARRGGRRAPHKKPLPFAGLAAGTGAVRGLAQRPKGCKPPLRRIHERVTGAIDAVCPPLDSSAGDAREGSAMT